MNFWSFWWRGYDRFIDNNGSIVRSHRTTQVLFHFSNFLHSSYLLLNFGRWVGIRLSHVQGFKNQLWTCYKLCRDDKDIKTVLLDFFSLSAIQLPRTLLSKNPTVMYCPIPLNPPSELTHTPNWAIHTKLLGVWFCKIGCCPLSPCWLSTLLIKRRSLGKCYFSLLLYLSASGELLIVPGCLPTQRRIRLNVVFFDIWPAATQHVAISQRSL